MNTQEQRERAAFTACYCDESYDQDIIILSGEDCEYANKAEQAQLWDAHCRFLAYIVTMMGSCTMPKGAFHGRKATLSAKATIAPASATSPPTACVSVHIGMSHTISCC